MAITISRKPSNSDYNREFIKISLPNDNNPEEVSAFLNRFYKLMFDVVQVDTEDSKDPKDKSISLVEELTKKEED